MKLFVDATSIKYERILILENIYNNFMKTDLKDHYLESAENLQRKNNYPYEMMPLLYAIVKSTQGDLHESQKLIHEGNLAYKYIGNYNDSVKASTCKLGSESRPMTPNGNYYTLKSSEDSSEEPSNQNLEKKTII